MVAVLAWREDDDGSISEAQNRCFGVEWMHGVLVAWIDTLGDCAK